MMIRNKGMGLSCGLMDAGMMAIGLMGNNMEKGPIHLLMGNKEGGSGRQGRDRGGWSDYIGMSTL